MEFNKQIAEKMRIEYNNRKLLAVQMYEYYCNKSDILLKYPSPLSEERSNRRVSDNFIKTFIDEEVSFMVGKSVTYTSDQENCISDIKKILNRVDSAIDIKTVTNMLIFGCGYELYYKNNDEFKIKSFSPLTSYTYLNEEGQALLFMRYYTKELDDNIYIEFIDDKYIYHMDENFNILKHMEGKEEKLEVYPHYMNCCPIGVSILPNVEKDTLFNNIKSLQDAYECTMSDWGNEISDTRLAYLLLTGVSLDKEQAKQMKEMGIIDIPEPNGKGEFLVKSLNSDYIKSYRDITKEDIYRVANHIDNQTQVQSNTSGNMLIVRMNCLRLKIDLQSVSFKNCLRTRLKCLCRYLNLVDNKDYDYNEIVVSPQINLPQNDMEIAQIVNLLSGKISLGTLLNLLSFVSNGNEEVEKLIKENNKLLGGNIDLDNISPIGKENNGGDDIVEN